MTAADLGDTLNSAPEITVFAPANDAFEAVPPKDLNALLADKADPDQGAHAPRGRGQARPRATCAGTHKTLNGDTVTVEGSGENFTVGSSNANIDLRQRADRQRDGLHHRRRPDAR